MHYIKQFTAIGEAMVELSPKTEHGDYRVAFAGDTFNTAWYIKQLSPMSSVEYVTRVGKDELSQQFLDFSQDQGIGAAFTSQSTDRNIGLYMINNHEHGERSFSYWRSHSAARELMLSENLLTKALQKGGVVYFSGITLAILDVVARTRLIEVLAAARSHNLIIAFDSNLRPALWESRSAMCAWVSQAASLCDVVLPSFDDEQNYFSDNSPKDTLARYQQAGATTVVVKNSHKPIVYAHQGKVSNYQPKTVTSIADTTAAGDSFNGGFLYGLLHNKSVDQSVKIGSDLAAQVIQKRGALIEVAKNSLGSA